jgi:uncharacterized protein (DUF927 family)
MSEDAISITEARKRQSAKAGVRRAMEGAAVADPAAAADAEARVAARFTMTADGLYKNVPGKFPERICDHFDVLGETREPATKAFGLLVAFRDRDMREVEYVIAREAFTGESLDLTRALARRGFSIRPGRAAANALAEYLFSIQSVKRAFIVGQSGWHLVDNSRLFVLPDFAAGEGETRVVHQSRLSGVSPFATAGTLEAWRANVAALAVGNSRLTLSISGAFAGPLLDLVGEDGGIVHLRGHSKSGKTTCLRAAASVWGYPGAARRTNFMRTWRATSVGLEEIAAMHSDTFLPLDELGAADAREVGDVVYFLSSGQGRTRGSRGGGGLRETLYFRVMVLSSGEVALSDKMEEAAKGTRAGQEIRLLDLDAGADQGTGVFETLQGMPSVADFAGALVRAAAKDHGHAGPAFAGYLIERLRDDPAYGAGLADEAGEIASAWLRDIPNVGAQVATAARRFALIAVAGSVATDAGLTGWPEPAAREAAHKCFLAWLDGRGFAGSREDEEAISRLRAFCQTHGKARFEEWPEPRGAQAEFEAPEDLRGDRVQVYNRVGWRRRMHNDAGGQSWRYYLTAPGLREALKGLDFRRSLQVLAERGFLGADKDRKPGGTVRVPGYDTQRLYMVLPKLFTDARE